MKFFPRIVCRITIHENTWQASQVLYMCFSKNCVQTSVTSSCKCLMWRESGRQNVKHLTRLVKGPSLTKVHTPKKTAKHLHELVTEVCTQFLEKHMYKTWEACHVFSCIVILHTILEKNFN